MREDDKRDAVLDWRGFAYNYPNTSQQRTTFYPLFTVAPKKRDFIPLHVILKHGLLSLINLTIPNISFYMWINKHRRDGKSRRIAFAEMLPYIKVRDPALGSIIANTAWQLRYNS